MPGIVECARWSISQRDGCTKGPCTRNASPQNPFPSRQRTAGDLDTSRPLRVWEFRSRGASDRRCSIAHVNSASEHCPSPGQRNKRRQQPEGSNALACCIPGLDQGGIIQILISLLYTGYLGK
mmetsp:Transcript_61437/g.165033  ORF Transcript_61437/g.165033 Transcript_61437/m.165033 type:complete len:123 (-) Transcript_61437:218-586(-)